MSRSGTLDADTADTIRLTVAQAEALAHAALECKATPLLSPASSPPT